MWQGFLDSADNSTRWSKITLGATIPLGSSVSISVTTTNNISNLPNYIDVVSGTEFWKMTGRYLGIILNLQKQVDPVTATPIITSLTVQYR